MSRKGLWLFQNKTQLIGEGRIIFLVVMGLNWGRQEKDLTQFQQLLMVMTKKKEQTGRDTRDVIAMST